MRIHAIFGGIGVFAVKFRWASLRPWSRARRRTAGFMIMGSLDRIATLSAHDHEVPAECARKARGMASSPDPFDAPALPSALS